MIGQSAMRPFLALLCGGLLMAAAGPAAWAQQAGTTFRDCDDCAEMVVVPAGSFMMGADENFEDANDDETPRHRVTIARPLTPSEAPAEKVARIEAAWPERPAVAGADEAEFPVAVEVAANPPKDAGEPARSPRRRRRK